jgi:hypothetical protein
MLRKFDVHNDCAIEIMKCNYCANSMYVPKHYEMFRKFDPLTVQPYVHKRR